MRATTGTFAPTTTPSATAEDLLRFLKDAGQIPNASSFHPTPEAPIYELLLGEVDGQPVYAYGRRTSWVGVTGPHLSPVRVFEWKWWFDKEMALRQANLDLYTDSDDGNAWLCEPLPTLNLNAVEDVQSRTVTPVAGTPFTVYRIIKFGSMNLLGKWHLCLEEEPCEILHDSIWCATWRGDNITDDVPLATPTPLVHIVEIAPCPHCREIVCTYGATIISDRNHTRRIEQWWRTLEEAQEQRDKSERTRLKLITCGNQRAEERAKEEILRVIRHEAYGLSTSRRYRDFKGTVPEDLLTTFEQADHEIIGRDNRELCADPELLDKLARLEEATAALKKALDNLYETRYLEVIEHDLVAKLRNLLATHFPTCPICNEEYTVNEEWLTDLLVFGGNLLSCSCPRVGWGSFEGERPRPDLVREILNLRFGLANRHVHMTHYPGFEWPSQGIEIEHIEAGEHVPVRFVLMERNLSLQSAIVVNRAELIATSGDTRRKNVWPRTAMLILREWRAELEVSVSMETILNAVRRIPLRWSNTSGWHAEKEEDGKLVRFQVRAEHDKDVQTPGWWYCRIMRIPQDRETEDFRLVIIQPVLPAPKPNP